MFDAGRSPAMNRNGANTPNKTRLLLAFMGGCPRLCGIASTVSPGRGRRCRSRRTSADTRSRARSTSPRHGPPRRPRSRASSSAASTAIPTTLHWQLVSQIDDLGQGYRQRAECFDQRLCRVRRNDHVRGINNLGRDRLGFGIQRYVKDEQLRLLQAHYADAITLPVLKKEQHRLAGHLADIEQRLGAYQAGRADAKIRLRAYLHLATNAHALYTHCEPAKRRLCNQAFFTKIIPTEDHRIETECNGIDETVPDPTNRLQA